jgi:hypothetical protein
LAPLFKLSSYFCFHYLVYRDGWFILHKTGKTRHLIKKIRMIYCRLCMRWWSTQLITVVNCHLGNLFFLCYPFSHEKMVTIPNKITRRMVLRAKSNYVPQMVWSVHRLNLATPTIDS